MVRKSSGNPVGPPQKSIDWTLFEQLCAVQCTQSEIASMLKVHVDTLRDRTKEHYNEDYSTIYKKYAENGKCSLRRNQFVLSKSNTAMAIWLGKQWLGQKDTAPNESTPNDTQLALIPELMKQNLALQTKIQELEQKINASQPKAS